MRKTPNPWWQRAADFWDKLCALRERGLTWMLRCFRQAIPVIVRRARLELEELQPRIVLNTAPVAVADAYSVLHDHTLNVAAAGVLANDTDADNDTLHANVVTGPAHAASFSLNSNGALVYTPTTGYVGTDSFQYKDFDGTVFGNTVTVTLTITDAAPVATADSYSVLHDHTLSVSAAGVLSNDTDADSDTLHASTVTGPAHAASFTLNSDGSFSYHPTTGYSGTDSFVYKAGDGALYSSNTTVTLTVTDAAPVATADSYSVLHDQTLIVSAAGVLSNDTDADSDTLSATLVSGPSHSVAFSLNANGSFTYHPTTGYTGTDSFVYKAGDGALYSSNTTVSLSISDAAPVALDDSYTVTGGTLGVSAPGVLGNDSDADSDSLHTVLVTGPSHGTGFTLSSSGGFMYGVTGGFTGVDHFTYKANDGALNSNTATVYLGVGDTAPVATGESYVLHGGSLIVLGTGVLGNDTDANSDPLHTVLIGGPSHGVLTLNADGSFSYTPDGTFAGTDSFTYQASDGVLTSSTVTVSLSGPDLTGLGLPFSATAGVATSSSTIVATVTDTDLALTAADISGSVNWGDESTPFAATSANGGIVNNFDGTFSVLAGHSYTTYGILPVSIAVADSVNSLTASAYTTATVIDPLVLTNPGTHTSSEGDTITFALSAIDAISGTTLTYDATGLPPGLSFDPSSGGITGDIALGDAANGPYQVVVAVTDGTFTDSKIFTWNVNTPITLTNPGDQSGNEGDGVTLAISASDSSGTLHFAATGLPPGLAISTTTGTITGTLAVGAAAAGPYTVTLTASDDTYSVSQTFLWTVSNPISITLPSDQTNLEGDTVSLAISASGGGTLAFTATGLPPGLSINTGTGTITGTVAIGSSVDGPYYVTIAAGDDTFQASVTILWTVNNPITITAPADQTSSEGASVSLAISASGGGTLTYGAIGLPAGLSIDSSTGTISGNPSIGDAAAGPYMVELLAEDGTYSAETTFQWTVTSAVTITAPDDQQNAAGDTVTLAISASAAGTLSYSATGLPNGLSINSSTGAITGTLTAGGSWQTTVTASDGTASASAAFFWDVSSPITITDPGPQAFNAGGGVSLPISASGGGTLNYAASGLPTGLSINASTGLISGTISSGLSAGIYHSTLTVDDGTDSAVLALDWTVYPVSSIVVTNPGTQTNAEGDSPSWSVSASYSGSGTLVYAALGLPAGLVINPSTGAITGTVSAGDSVFGPYFTTVTVSDGTDSDSQSFTWNVNSGISLTNPGTQTSTEGGSVSLNLSATYGGSGSVTYAALGLPAGLSLDPSTGAISGSIALGDAVESVYPVTVEASADSFVSVQTFTWNIGSPVTLTAPADQTGTEGATISLALSATDSSSGTLKYSATGLPPGLKLNPSTGAITGTLALGAAANGPYAVTVTAQDDTYSVSQTFNFTVNSPVSITIPDDQTSNEGDAISLTLTGTDSASGTLKFAAQGLPPGLVIDPTSGAITGYISAGAAPDGPYYVTIGAGDDTYSSSISFIWNVNSPITITTPDDQTSSAGDTVSLTIAASGGGTLTYSASDLPNGLSINSSTGAITGTLSAGGYFAPTVTASDGTYTNNITFAWTVNSPITITDPGSQEKSAGDSVSLTIAASGGGTLSFSASGLPAGLSINSSTGEISGTLTASASNDPYSSVITVTDGTNTAVNAIDWYIDPAGPVVLFNPGDLTSTAGDELAFFVQASDNNGGTLMYSATGLPDGLYINPVTGLVFGTIAGTANTGSPYTVTVQTSDGTDSATQTYNWIVNAAGPLTLTNPGDQSGSEGDSVSLALSGTYTGAGTLSYVAFGLPPGLKINSGTGTISGTLASGAAASGPYDVIVVVGDGTYTATQEFAWNLVNPITLTLPDDQSSSEGDTVSLTLSATDATSGTLSYAAAGLPGGLKINSSTGAITGIVAPGAAAAGPYFVTITAENGTYSATQSFNWNVSSPISITLPDDQSSNEGDSPTLTITATGGGTLTFSAVGLPSGLAINPTTGVISGTIAGGTAGIGAYFPTITASDGTSSATQSFEWDVSSPLTLDTPDDQFKTVGDNVTLQVVTTYSGVGTLSYSASGLPTGLSINTSSGLITGSLTSGAADIGTFVTTITASDGTSSSSVGFLWSVSAASTVLTLSTPADQSSSEGASPSLTLSASYTGSGTLSYFAEGLPFGLKIDPTTGFITGTVAVGAAGYGPYSVTVFATDGTLSVYQNFLWTISSPVTVTVPTDQSGIEGDTPTLPVSATDTTSGTLHYSAVGLPPGLSINTATGVITGAVAAGAAGIFSVTVTAANGTYSDSETFTLNFVSPLTLLVPPDQTTVEGGSGALTLIALGSGTLRYSAQGLPPGLKIDTSTGVVSGTVAPGAAMYGPYFVTVMVSNGSSSTDQTFLWTVTDPITIADIGVQTASAGYTVSLLVHAADVYAGALSYFADWLPTGLTLSKTTGAITGTISSTLAAAGEFVTSIKVTDGLYSAVQSLVWNVTAPVLGLTTVLLTKAPLPINDINKAQKIANQGVPVVNGVTDTAGPDVTQWFARDLIYQIKHSFDSARGLKWNLFAFKDQAANKMSYKWLDFGGPLKGRGVNTVILGDSVMRKQELGNIAFLFIPTIRPLPLQGNIIKIAAGWDSNHKDDFFKQQVLAWPWAKPANKLEQMAQIGYAVEPYYRSDPFGRLPPNRVVYRADNLVAFAVGRQIALSFLDKVAPGNPKKARETLYKALYKEKNIGQLNRNILLFSGYMEQVLHNLFDNKGKNLAKVVDTLGKLQPVTNRPALTLAALSFTPDYGGFNLNSLSRKGVRSFKSNINSIGMETALRQSYGKLFGTPINQTQYQNWRVTQFQNWTSAANGFRFPDVKYP